ncbi:MAG: DUF5050 domain-containing protein [Oscillospiraceae bacterium]|jgi:hypothetical protein|nr:DUF5050 domain-containing protein [Oscillospiraceae bacterium]
MGRIYGASRLRRGLALVILLAVAAAAPVGGALALTNAQLQLSGGLAAAYGSETYFFAPVEENTWGLFAVSTCAGGPIATLPDVKPVKLLYADANKVCFTAVSSNEGQLLASVDIKSGKPTMLLDKVKEIYYETEETVFYSSYEDQLTLYRYSFPKNTSTKLKTMTSKNIYDSMAADNGKVYFLGKDIRDGSVVAYEISKPGAKAVNMNPPSPNIGDGYLYGGYLVYTPKGDTTQVYTVPMGKTKAIRIGEKVTSMSLSNARLGDALITRDADNNALTRVPLDGSETSSVALATTDQANTLMGGAADTLYFWDDGQVWSVDSQLRNKTALFPFSVSGEGVSWTNISPTTGGAALMYGYSIMTYLDSFGVTLPTVVRVMDPATGQALFQSPAEIPTAEGVSQTSAAPFVSNPGEPAPPEENPVGDDEDISFFGT